MAQARTGTAEDALASRLGVLLGFADPATVKRVGIRLGIAEPAAAGRLGAGDDPAGRREAVAAMLANNSYEGGRYLPLGVLGWMLERDDPELNAVIVRDSRLADGIRRDVMHGVPFGVEPPRPGAGPLPAIPVTASRIWGLPLDYPDFRATEEDGDADGAGAGAGESDGRSKLGLAKRAGATVAGFVTRSRPGGSETGSGGSGHSSVPAPGSAPVSRTDSADPAGPADLAGPTDLADFADPADPGHESADGTGFDPSNHAAAADAAADADADADVNVNADVAPAPDPDPTGLIAALRRVGSASKLRRARHLAKQVSRADWALIAEADQALPLGGYVRWALSLRPDCPEPLREQFGSWRPRYEKRMHQEGIYRDLTRYLTEDVWARTAVDTLAIAGWAFPDRIDGVFDLLGGLVRDELGDNVEAWAVFAQLLPDFTGTLPELLVTAGAIAHDA